MSTRSAFFEPRSDSIMVISYDGESPSNDGYFPSLYHWLLKFNINRIIFCPACSNTPLAQRIQTASTLPQLSGSDAPRSFPHRQRTLPARHDSPPRQGFAPCHSPHNRLHPLCAAIGDPFHLQGVRIIPCSSREL